MPAIKPGTLLDGRVSYGQSVDGYRTGIEPVLLAAAVPARPGERVVEGGTGAGAGLLCLACRVPRLRGLGLEIDPGLVALALHNLAANGHAPGQDGLDARQQDVAAWCAAGTFDHAFANPPWHTSDGTRSPSAGRQLAKIAGRDLLACWAVNLAAGLRRRGTLSLVLPAAACAHGIAALQAGRCAEIAILPLWPHAGEPARLVILRGVREGKGASQILPGLTLHHEDGSYTAAATAILRNGAPLQ